MATRKNILFATVLATILLFASCNRFGDPKPPKPLLDENRMVEIITDIEIIEAKLNFANERGGSADSLKDSYYQQLYDHHGITKEQLTKNLNYYTQKPQVLEDIMSRVIDSLSQSQGF